MMAQKKDRDAPRRTFRTGFPSLDVIVAQDDPVGLVLLAGRPRTGKTTFALGMARHMAVEQKAPVVIFSLEHSAAEVHTRMLCLQAHVDKERLSRGRLDAAEEGRVTDASKVLASAPLIVDDRASSTAAEITTAVKRLSREGQAPGLVVVDYLQLIPVEGEGPDRHDARQMLRPLRALADELPVPVLLLAQLPRCVEDRADPRPVLADVDRYEADLVLLLHRDQRNERGSQEPGAVEVTVGGAQGVIAQGTLRLVPGS